MPPQADDVAQTDPSGATLNWAVRIMAAECVAMVVVVALLIYEDLTAAADSARGALAVTLYAALVGALFGLLAVVLRRRRGWARGPAIVLQLLLLPIGYSMLTGGLPWLGVVVMAAGLAGAGALLAPATRAALGMK